MAAERGEGAVDPDDSGKAKKPLSAYRAARRFLLGASALGLALPFVFAAQSSSLGAAASVVAVGLGIAVASMAAGGLVGFVFGIPTSLQNTRAPAEPNGQAPEDRHGAYAGNTSLEQISDWLTKILVGVGLTQLASIPSGLVALGDFLAGGLGDLPGATVFAPALVVFAVLDGFFLGYLWTRLHLPSLFAESDLLQELASAEERGREQGEQKALIATSTAAEAGVAAGVAPAAGALEGGLNALWADDQPDNNTNVRQTIERLLGVKFDIARTTDEAVTTLSANRDRYAFVISDMGRPSDRRAGFTLLQRLRDEGIDVPYIIYAASATSDQDRDAKSRGAVGMTNSPSRLLELVSQVVRGLTPPAKEKAAKPKP